MNNCFSYIATIEDKPCAFIAIAPFLHAKVKNIIKTHRLVVLPEYQGLGIGKLITDEIAKFCINNKMRYRETTSHPARISSHKKSKNWKCVDFGRFKSSTDKNKSFGQSSNRLTTSWEYVI